MAETAETPTDIVETADAAPEAEEGAQARKGG